MTPAPQSLPYAHCVCTCRFIVDGTCKYREMHVPTIAIDFDRVLFTHESWQGHYHVGEPIPGAREALLELQRMGFKIMVWTTRAQKEIVKNALIASSIPFDFINHNPNQPPEINPSKPVADYYIDDRAVRFTNWSDVLVEIKHREKHDPYYRASHNSNTTSAEKVLELLHNHYMRLYNERRPTNSGEQLSTPAKIFLSVAHRCTPDGIAELWARSEREQ